MVTVIAPLRLRNLNHLTLDLILLVTKTPRVGIVPMPLHLEDFID